MDYILKTSALLFLFLVGYRLFLQKETFFSSNRWFLLIGLLISVSFPLITIPIYETKTVYLEAVNTVQAVPISALDPVNAITVQTSTPIWPSVLWNLYWAGVVVFALRFLVQLVSVGLIMLQGNRKPYKSYTIFETKKDIAPFSFFKAIIYNPFALSRTAIQQILTHEKAHVRDWHSLDILICEIVLIFMWFNPLVWWYQKHLKQNLEFIADEHSIKEVPCAKTYQTVLVNQSLPKQQLAIANNFQSSFLKKRIIMLNKSKSNPFRQLKMIYILPFLVLFLFNFSTETRYLTEVIPPDHELGIVETNSQDELLEFIITKETSDAELQAIKKQLKEKDVVMSIKDISRDSNDVITKISLEFKTKTSSANYNVSETDGIEPIFFEMTEDGGISIGSSKAKDQITVLAKNIAKASSNKHGQVWISKDGGDVEVIELDSMAGGKVKYVTKSNAFFIDTEDENHVIEIDSVTNGKWSYTTKVVIGDHHNHLDNNKKNHFVYKLGSSPDSSYTIKLDSLNLNYDFDTDSKVFIVGDANNSIRKTGQTITVRNKGTSKHPLYIVDGKVISTGTINDINSDKIKSMNVIKGDNAVSLYGKKAKNGAVVITTKEGQVWVEDKGQNNVVYDYVFIDSDIEKSLFKIDKRSTGIELEKLKGKLESQGIDVKYSKIKRNELGEIIRIKIRLKNNQGDESSASYKTDDGIDTIYFGEQNGTLMVTTSPSN